MFYVLILYDFRRIIGSPAFYIIPPFKILLLITKYGGRCLIDGSLSLEYIYTVTNLTFAPYRACMV